MGATENKALVQKWLSQGVSSPASMAMVTDDFTWTGPRSLSIMFEHGDATLRGPDSLRDIPNLDKAIYRGYDASENNSNVHFMIAEGDVVVMEFDASFTTHEGEPYHNQYCLVFITRDCKVAEVHEHVDSHYSYEVCLGTPEKRAGVLERLARLRAGDTLPA